MKLISFFFLQDYNWPMMYNFFSKCIFILFAADGNQNSQDHCHKSSRGRKGYGIMSQCHSRLWDYEWHICWRSYWSWPGHHSSRVQCQSWGGSYIPSFKPWRSGSGWMVNISNLINNRRMSWQSHTLSHDQNKHPIENFISQTLSKIH